MLPFLMERWQFLTFFRRGGALKQVYVAILIFKWSAGAEAKNCPERWIPDNPGWVSENKHSLAPL